MIKQEKKKRRPAGWKITDRICKLCSIFVPKDKYLNRHHLCYDPEIIVSLHYNCHNVVHGRVRYNCPFDKMYGIDFAPVMRSLAILRLYHKVLPRIKTKFPSEFKET